MTIQIIKSGLFVFGGGIVGLDRIKTNNQEKIINNPSKQIQTVFQLNGMSLRKHNSFDLHLRTFFTT